MAEMCIWLLDQEGADFYATAKRPQRGDVMAVKPDGWVWAIPETQDPFLVVKVPDASVDDLVEFLSFEMPQPGNEEAVYGDPTNTLQFRGFKVDVDAYVPPGGAVLRSGTEVPLDTVMSLKVQRPPIPDPKAVDAGKIIG